MALPRRKDPMLGAPAFKRIKHEAYFTLDAEMAVGALLGAVAVHGPVLEPCAGVGHLVVELRKRGIETDAADLVAHPQPLITGIEIDDVMAMKSLRNYSSLVTNLPYRDQDRILRHILPIAHRDEVAVAILTRSAWHHAKARRELVHENPWFHGIVHLPRRPWWSEDRTHSPRYDFTWVVWGAHRREAEHPAIFYPAGVS